MMRVGYAEIAPLFEVGFAIHFVLAYLLVKKVLDKFSIRILYS